MCGLLGRQSPDGAVLKTKKQQPPASRDARTSAEREPTSNCSRSSANRRRLTINRRQLTCGVLGAKKIAFQKDSPSP